MRARNLLLVLSAVAAMIAVAALSEPKKSNLFLLDWANRGSKERPPAAILIEFGLKDKTPEKWSGRAVVTGAKVVHREGYRFRPDDKLHREGSLGGVLASRPARAAAQSRRRAHGGHRHRRRRPASERHPGRRQPEHRTGEGRRRESRRLPQGRAGGTDARAVGRQGAGAAGDDGDAADRRARRRTISPPPPTVPTARSGWRTSATRSATRAARVEQKQLTEQPTRFQGVCILPNSPISCSSSITRTANGASRWRSRGRTEDLVRCAIAVEGNGVVRVAYSANRKGHKIMSRTLRFHRENAEYRVGPETALFEEGSQLNPVMEYGPKGERLSRLPRRLRRKKASRSRTVVGIGSFPESVVLCFDEQGSFDCSPRKRSGNRGIRRIAAGPDGRVAIAVTFMIAAITISKC